MNGVLTSYSVKPLGSRTVGVGKPASGALCHSSEGTSPQRLVISLCHALFTVMPALSNIVMPALSNIVMPAEAGIHL